MKQIDSLVFLPLLVFSFLAVGTVEAGTAKSIAPTYPIDADVYTTLDKTNAASPPPVWAKPLLPCEVSEYEQNGYGMWNPEGPGYPFIKPDMTLDTKWPPATDASLNAPSNRDPSTSTLLTFFSMSDVHITDKESPAQAIFYCYEGGYFASSSWGYSGCILYTTHVLDAAVQTINALHKQAPFDFGIALGDAVNNTQYNELRWYLDVIDGKKITPSSGAHLGAKTTLYQMPYQAAGLDKSISWYQAVGNHDLFWTGSALPDDYIKKTLVGSSILNLGEMSPSDTGALSARGFYMGVVDGTTPFGDIIDVGAADYFSKPPKVAADKNRYSLSLRNWMGEFLKTTSNPVGHGFTKELKDGGFASYHFYPRADIPLKVIVLDDTDKAGSDLGSLDYERYNWLVNELDEGEAAGELMIVCAHIPILPYTLNLPPENDPAQNPYFPLMPMYAQYSMVSEVTLRQKLWTYQNLVMWMSGHVHRNTITPQPPDATSPYVGDLTHGFWEVEIPSLRDFPQEFRRFEIVRNTDNNISIFALDVDPAVNTDFLPNTMLKSPAWTSRSYAIAATEIYGYPVQTGPNVDPLSGVYNAELVKQMSPAMQAKLALILPAVSSFQINSNARTTKSQTVTLNNTVAGTTPTQYMASESPIFTGAAWHAYTNAPSFTLSFMDGAKTVYFKVKDATGTESAVVSDSIVFK